MTATAREMDPSAADFNEKEHVQRLQAKGFNREEIAGEELLLVVIEEGPPIQASSSFWRRDDASPSQNIFHRDSVQRVAQLLQLTVRFPCVVTPGDSH